MLEKWHKLVLTVQKGMRIPSAVRLAMETPNWFSFDWYFKEDQSLWSYQFSSVLFECILYLIIFFFLWSSSWKWKVYQQFPELRLIIFKCLFLFSKCLFSFFLREKSDYRSYCSHVSGDRDHITYGKLWRRALFSGKVFFLCMARDFSHCSCARPSHISLSLPPVLVLPTWFCLWEKQNKDKYRAKEPTSESSVFESHALFESN